VNVINLQTDRAKMEDQNKEAANGEKETPRYSMSSENRESEVANKNRVSVAISTRGPVIVRGKLSTPKMQGEHKQSRNRGLLTPGLNKISATTNSI